MIHSYACENFYSFQNRTEVSFVVDKDAPQNDLYFTTPSKTRLSKINMVIGANASGKTHILKVLPFLHWLIVNPSDIPPNSQIPIEQFRFTDQEKPTIISVVFEISNGTIYTYTVSLTKDRIEEEELYETQSGSPTSLFVREWNGEKYDLSQGKGITEKTKEIFKGIKFSSFSEATKKAMRSNVSIIGTAWRYNHPESTDIVNCWLQVMSNVGAYGWSGDLYQNRSKDLYDVMQLYKDNDEVKQHAEKHIKQFDTGLSGFKIQQDKEGGLSLYGQHQVNAKDYNLPLKYESTGTKQLLVAFASVLSMFHSQQSDQEKNGNGVLVMDEFDTNLHHYITKEIIKWFSDPDMNSRNTQVLLSTHNYILLNQVDKYNIFIVAKDRSSQASEVYRLDKVQGVELDDNYFQEYIAGAYEGVPKIS